MKFSGKVLALAIALSLGVMSLNVCAEEDDGIPAARKLGRGITNVALGALEIPMRIYDVNEEDGGFAAVTYGVLKGISFKIRRGEKVALVGNTGSGKTTTLYAALRYLRQNLPFVGDSRFHNHIERTKPIRCRE